MSKIENLKIKPCWYYFSGVAQHSQLANFNSCRRLISEWVDQGWALLCGGLEKCWGGQPAASPCLHPSTRTRLISAALFAAGGIRADCPLQPTLTCTFLGSGQTDTGPYQLRLFKKCVQIMKSESVGCEKTQLLFYLSCLPWVGRPHHASHRLESVGIVIRELSHFSCDWSAVTHTHTHCNSMPIIHSNWHPLPLSRLFIHRKSPLHTLFSLS